MFESSPSSPSEQAPADIAECAAIAFIIPARNEAETIGSVTQACMQAADSLKRTAEVIVVSDGSQDATADIARVAGARCVELLGSRGSKARALEAGVAATRAGLLVFVDGDCLDLTSNHLTHLLALYREHESLPVGMVVGIFDYKRIGRLVQIIPWSTGQRVIRRDVFENAVLKADNYDIEVSINETIGSLGLATVSLLLKGVHHRSKMDKIGRIRGIKATLRMWRSIAARTVNHDWAAYRRYATNVLLADMSSLRIERAPHVLTYLGAIAIKPFFRLLSAGSVAR